MRNTDLRFSSINETPNNIRFPLQYIPFPNQSQNIYYPAPIALHLSPSQINSGSHLNNNVVYQSVYQIGHQPLMLSSNPHLVISVPCTPNNISDNNNLSNQSSIDSHLSSSVTSPASILSTQNQNLINYSLSKWLEISSFYDGKEDSRPSAGQLNNGKYFTQRSAGKDIYMVFNSKADYINNFVNYYFSNKNLSTDEKLFNLMDDTGSVALSDLMKFPRLAQIGTTIENIVEALKYSQFVVIVNLKNEIKGIRRSDGWFPSKLSDESPTSVSNSQRSSATTIGSNGDNIGSASLHTSNSDIYRHTTLNGNTPATNNIASYQNNIDLSSTTTNVQSHHQNNDLKSQIDSAIANANNNNINNNSLIYFNTVGANNGGTVQQPMQYVPAAFVHGIHQNNFTHTLQGSPSQSQNTSQILSATTGNGQQLIINAQSHYPTAPNSTFFQQNPSIQLRSVWQGVNLPDLTRSNHVLYNSSNKNNNNLRHVIGAGGNNQTNFKQCQY